jgi:hypothetical protein
MLPVLPLLLLLLLLLLLTFAPRAPSRAGARGGGWVPHDMVLSRPLGSGLRG